MSPPVDSTLYLAGGEFPDGSASREMWRYDPCFDSWMEMAPMNVARSELGEGVLVIIASVFQPRYPILLLKNSINYPNFV